MRSFLSLLLATTLAVPGCATARAAHARIDPGTSAQRAAADPKVMADYVRQLPVGSRVRLARANGDEIRGTLMKNDGDPLVVQRRTRIPEPPIEVPLRDVMALELDTTPNGNPGRAIAIGAAAAASATLGILLLLAAIYSD